MKTLILKISILLMTLSLIFGLTACDKEAIATLEKEVVAENEKVEASEVKDQEEEPEIEETEGKKSIAEINAELAKKQKSQDGKNKSKLSQSIKENTEEFRAFRERMRRDYKGKSLGKLYPKHTLTWNGITLEYLPIPEELNPESEAYLLDFEDVYRKSCEYIDAGYILEGASSFKRNDGKSTHWGAHNQTPGFEPFSKIALGDDIYVTGDKGSAFHYKVIDIIDWYHGGDFTRDVDSYCDSFTGNLAKLKGQKELRDVDEYDYMPIESITLSWCRDDLFLRYIFAVPIEHYEVYVEEGIIDPVD